MNENDILPRRDQQAHTAGLQQEKADFNVKTTLTTGKMPTSQRNQKYMPQ
ncbi:hypothetical protein [Aquitalea denitrificans]|nr:hypothetical protein [Aquitalea denitrificans]